MRSDGRPVADETAVSAGAGVIDHYRLLSLPVQIMSEDEWFARAMRWYLEPFRRPVADRESVLLEVRAEGNDRGDGQLVYLRNGAEEMRGSRMGVLHHAVWDVHRIVPTWSRDFLFIHAGSVAHGGRALLLPGAPGGGKTTLVTALLRRGFDYLSDELGAIDPVSGDAYPFPKRLSLEPDALTFFPGLAERLGDIAASGIALGKRYVRPEDLDARTGAAAPVRLIVFLGPQRPGRPESVPLTRAETVARLAASALNLYRYRERGVVLLSRVASRATAYELSGGDPNALADAVAELLDGPAE